MNIVCSVWMLSQTGVGCFGCSIRPGIAAFYFLLCIFPWMRTFGRSTLCSGQKEEKGVARRGNLITDFAKVTSRSIPAPPLKKEERPNSQEEKSKKHKQYILNFGQRTTVHCHVCGILFCPASEEDLRIHNRLHKQCLSEKNNRQTAQ